MGFGAFFVLTMLPLCCLTANMHWSSVSTLSNPAIYDSHLPQILAHPSQQSAKAIWVALGEDTYSLFTTDFSANNWDAATLLASSSHFLYSPRLSVDGSGHYVAIWDESNGSVLSIQAAQNSGSGWSAPQLIHTVSVGDDQLHLNLSTNEEGVAVISWQDSDARLHGLTYENEELSAPYFLSQEGLAVETSILAPNLTLFTTDTGVDATPFDPINPPTDPISQNLYPIPVKNPLLQLGFASDGVQSISIFQDRKSLFLISAILKNGSNWSHSIVDMPYASVLDVQAAISPTSNKGAAIWQLSSGTLKAAVFDGREWGDEVTLSSNGSAPSIAFNPLNDHVIAVWGDLAEGGVENSVKLAEFDNTNWSSPTSISATGTSFGETQIHINAPGYGFIVWTRIPTPGDHAIVEAVTGS